MTQICRICLENKPEMLSIYDNCSDDYNLPIFNMIMYCACIKIEKGDGLPDLLCPSCKIRLQVAYIFKRDCEQSDLKLRSVDFSKNQCKIEVQHDDINHEFDINSVKLEIKSDSINYDDEIDDNNSEYLENLNIESLKNESDSDKNDSDFNIETELNKNQETNIIKKVKRKRSRKSKSGTTSRQPRFICYVCGELYRMRDDFEKHKTESHLSKRFVCDLDNCDSEFKQLSELFEHRKDLHNLNNYINCQLCSITFSNLRSFDRHVYNKHVDRTFGCIKCSKMFLNNDELEIHVDKYHSKTYKCDVCEKVFSRSERLKSHSNIHTNSKPFVCSECGKCFSDRSGLNRHYLSHKKSGDNDDNSSKKNNSLCCICGKSFRRSCNLTKHMHIHSDYKPYGCELCTFRSRSRQNLKCHMLTHTGEKPYKCSYCEKSFGTRGYLTIHERFHSGYRPYKCSTCQKGFTNKKDLTVHERTHTGIKLYSCSVCSNSFTTLHYLKVHMSKHGELKTESQS